VAEAVGGKDQHRQHPGDPRLQKRNDTEQDAEQALRPFEMAANLQRSEEASLSRNLTGVNFAAFCC
jgi:hypothetical protein